MQRHRVTSASSLRPASRANPLALALALALAGGAGVADEALAGRAPAVGTPTPAAGDVRAAAVTRPDGSVLWLVENCNDAGAGSLRSVAASANHGDGIDLGALSCSTITLTSGAITLRDVELTGPGQAQLEIDGTGNQNKRIFNHSSAGGVLDISGVTVKNGKYLSNAGQGGGCLRSTGGSLRIRDATLSGCMVVTPVNADGSARGGAIASYGSGTVELVDTTISGGWARTDHAQALGGGVYAQGHIEMLRSTISNNSTSASGSGAFTAGGGLFTRAGVWIEQSTIDGNVSAGGGGGALVEQGGVLLRSTVSNNFSSLGASGIAFLGLGNSMASVYSSTISGNAVVPSAPLLGGGLYMNNANASIFNSTITANSETNDVSTKFGAGIVFGPDVTTALLRSTIVSGNYYDDGAPPYADDDIDGPASLTILGDSNIVGWSHRPTPPDTIHTNDPGVGPLRDNGGPTWTHFPRPHSPALDAGNAQGVDTDQRGEPRVSGAGADIGSVELEDHLFADGFDD